MSDIGAMSELTFRITQLDKQTGEEQQRFRFDDVYKQWMDESKWHRFSIRQLEDAQ